MTHSSSAGPVPANQSLDDQASRRMLLTLGGAAALALLSSKAEAQTGGNPPGFEVSSQWRNPTNRLIRRLTNGIYPGDVARGKQMGFQGFLDYHLDFGRIDNSFVDNVIATKFPKMAWTEAKLYDDRDQYDQYLQLVYSTIYRQCFSRRQLYERMVEFWTDHFNVHVDKVGAPLMTTYIQKNIRRHAMGNFYNLLKSTAHSAAMLHYLDNDANSAYAPNINYTRELHELHTVGVDGGYTGKDLRQASLVMSGWTWSWRSESYNRGRFRFEVDDHAGGTKKVMGQTYAEDGQNEGEKLLVYLANHPNTARFITKKLINWFLGEGNWTTVWTNAQRAFLQSHGDIRTVLRVILTQQNLMASNGKYKRPAHLLYSSFRGCGSRINEFGSILYGPLFESGHVPFDWSPPDGYPDRFQFWAPSQMPRINTALRVAGNYIGQVQTDVVRVFGADRTPAGCLNTILQTLFGGEISVNDRNKLSAFLQAQTITDQRLIEAVALALACPSFQWY